MRPVLAALWLACFCTSAAANEPDPREVLNEARDLARQAKYEEALQKHLWFHENALKHQPSMTGVRLSFALAYWIELGEQYPQARQALVAIRDKTNTAIREGNGSFELFHDVSAINGYLKEAPKTVELFKILHERLPDLAKRCYPAVEEELAAQGDYKLCSGYIPDPFARFDRIKRNRELALQLFKDHPPELKHHADKQFAEKTCSLIEILVGAGRQPEAVKIRDVALAVRDDPAIRQAVETAVDRQKKSGR